MASCKPALQHNWLQTSQWKQFAPRASFQVVTLVMSRMLRPSRAAPTEPMPIWPPKIQSATVMPRAPAVIFSFRLRGPSFFSSSLQATACHLRPCSTTGMSEQVVALPPACVRAQSTGCGLFASGLAGPAGLAPSCKLTGVKLGLYR